MGIKRPPLIVNNPFTRLTDEDEDDEDDDEIFALSLTNTAYKVHSFAIPHGPPFPNFTTAS